MHIFRLKMKIMSGNISIVSQDIQIQYIQTINGIRQGNAIHNITHNGPIKGFIGDSSPIRQAIAGIAQIVGLTQLKNVIIIHSKGHINGDKIDNIANTAKIIGAKMAANT